MYFYFIVTVFIMTGRQHAVIGAVCGLSAGLILKDSIASTSIVECVVGGILGGLIVDIDSSKSIASKNITNFVTIFICILAIVKILKIASVDGFLQNILNIAQSNTQIISFGALIVLGKLSPHRQFTHKIIGTMLFCTLAWLMFPTFIATGFILGYLSHIIADKTTPAGLKFFDIKLPLMDKRNRLKIHF